MRWNETALGYKGAFKELLVFVAVLFLIEGIDQLLFGNRLFQYGVTPRDFDHWHRIFFAPFLHAGWGHVAGNALGLVLLGSMVLVLGHDILAIVSLSAIVVGGVGLLVFGSPGVHSGASIIVYGLFGFLVVFALYERSVKSIIVCIVVLVFFHGLARGMLPGVPGMSWQGHLFGALGGAAAAALLSRKAQQRRALKGSGG